MKKKRLFNKKAIDYEVWFVLVELILIAIICIGMTDYLFSVKNNTLFEKNYLKKDIGLVATVINSAPGDVQYTYVSKEKVLSNFEFEFDKNKIHVKDAGKRLKINYPFMSDQDVAYTVRQEDKIFFDKKEGKLIIT